MGNSVFLIQLLDFRIQSAFVSKQNPAQHCSFFSHSFLQFPFPPLSQRSCPLFSILNCCICDCNGCWKNASKDILIVIIRPGIECARIRRPFKQMKGTCDCDPVSDFVTAPFGVINDVRSSLRADIPGRALFSFFSFVDPPGHPDFFSIHPYHFRRELPLCSRPEDQIPYHKEEKAQYHKRPVFQSLSAPSTRSRLRDKG